MRALHLTFLCLIYITLGGCKEQHQMVLDLSDKAEFFDTGFPSDLKQSDHGTLNLDNFPRKNHPFTKDYLHAISDLKTGYSPLMPIYVRFSANPTSDMVNIESDPLAYVESNSAIQLIDIDPSSPLRGKRYPIQVAFNDISGIYRPQGLLQIIPEGPIMRENNQYALIVNQSFVKNPSIWKQNETLKILLNEEATENDQNNNDLITAHEQFAALRRQLSNDNIDTSSLIAATTWTTGEPTKYFRDLMVALNEIEPPKVLSPWQLVNETEDFCVLESKWPVPEMQSGLIPYALPVFGGTIQRNELGEIEVKSYRHTPVHVTLPKQVMPQEGFPLLVYNHGTSGNSHQVFTRGYTNADGELTTQGNPAEIAAVRNWAASGMGGHLGDDHQQGDLILDLLFNIIPGFALNYVEYNIFNPAAMRDNLFQSVAERILYRRLINQTQFDASLCPGATGQTSDTGSEVLYLDPHMQVVMGQSLGSMTSVGQAALDPHGYQGLIPTGAGSYGFGLAVFYGGFEFGRIGDLLLPAYLQLDSSAVADDPFHPVWALAELALAPANTALHVNRWKQFKEEYHPPHVLVVQGHLDPEVTLEAQRPLMRALETDLIGEELAVSRDEQILPTLEWAELLQLAAPVVSNHPDGRTVGVVRYPEDGIMSGHYVTFQYEEPKHQIGCFLETIISGAPTIVVGHGIHGACK